MTFQIKQAVRELIWTKTALISPSGGGKTYSSLRLATGMLSELTKLGLQQNGKILLANTEQKRGYYYANEFVYDIVDIQAPHNPEKYVELIEFAVSQNYPILVLDSTTHEWEGKGGCLDLHQQAGGTFQSWGKVTPRHNKFLVQLADSPIHIIATMRADDQYVLEQGTDKTSVKKIGVGAQQRKGFEYEFTCTFLLDQSTNIAEPKKDNTHLFEHDTTLLTEKHGVKIIEWANSGSGYTPPVRGDEYDYALYDKLKKELKNIVKKAAPEMLVKFKDVYKEFDEEANPNNVKDTVKLQEMLNKLKEIK